MNGRNEQIPAANDSEFELPWTWKDYAAMTTSYVIVATLFWLMVWPA